MDTIQNQLLLPISADKIDAFCRRNHIRRLSLFGPILGDDFGPNSDVDVLVEFEADAHIGLLAFARTQRELPDILQRQVDLVTPNGLKPFIKQNILDRARIIYAA